MVMGCGTSGDPQSAKARQIKRVTFQLPERTYFFKKEHLSVKEGADVLETYLQLEKDIYKEERAPPAPALSHGMVRLTRIASALEGARLDSIYDEEQIMMPGSVSDIKERNTTPQCTAILRTCVMRRKGEQEDDSIRRVMEELGLSKKPELAMEHEEFIASLNRKAMMATKTSWLSQRKEEAQEEVDRMTERVHNLQALYEHQDIILSNLKDGGRTEDSRDLDRLRAYRDALYSGELSWREASRLVEAASALARVAAGDWELAKDETDGELRWKLGVETRRGIQEAVLCVQTAHTTLSGVQFPYCTPRELTTILQALEYIFTDMQIPERYNHGSEMFNNFHKRAEALNVWIKKVMEETIHKDVIEVDQRFSQVATTVTNQRVNLIRQLVGLGVVTINNNGEEDVNNRKNSYNQKRGLTRSGRLFSSPIR